MKINVQTALFRIEADSQIGTGHLMRQIALAQEIRNYGVKSYFLSRPLSKALRERIESEDFNYNEHSPLNIEEDVLRLLEFKNSVVIVDGYEFDFNFQKLLKARNQRVLFVDDYGHAEKYCSDFVLNQNAYASEIFYKNRDKETELLLGAKYALLRKEFQSWLSWNRKIPPRVEKILVTMGGADPENWTLRVLIELNQIVGETKAFLPTVYAFVGAANPHRAEIEKQISQFKNLRIELIESTKEISTWMAKVDCAISAGGSTCWELLFMQVPFAIQSIAANQERVVDALLSKELAFPLTKLRELISDASIRHDLATHGRGVVDGYGVRRVSAKILGSEIWLREVGESDCRLLFDWANDRETREASFSSTEIKWDEHVHWFSEKIKNKTQSLMWIGVDHKEQPVGVVRFSLNEKKDEATISVNLAPSHRGKGLGSALIDLGCRRLFSNTEVERVYAYIKNENARSVRAFQKALFSGMQEGLKYVRNRY